MLLILGRLIERENLWWNKKKITRNIFDRFLLHEENKKCEAEAACGAQIVNLSRSFRVFFSPGSTENIYSVESISTGELETCLRNEQYAWTRWFNSESRSVPFQCVKISIFLHFAVDTFVSYFLNICFPFRSHLRLPSFTTWGTRDWNLLQNLSIFPFGAERYTQAVVFVFWVNFDSRASHIFDKRFKFSQSYSMTCYTCTLRNEKGVKKRIIHNICMMHTFRLFSAFVSIPFLRFFPRPSMHNWFHVVEFLLSSLID